MMFWIVLGVVIFGCSAFLITQFLRGDLIADLDELPDDWGPK